MNLEHLLKENPKRFLSKVITMAESTLPEKRKEIYEFLKQHYTTPQNGGRIAITGAPGVGKSTFINALGSLLCQENKLAVLSIDPSSVHGGSILGDKTRMADLSAKEHVFLRPSPSGGHLGGLNSQTLPVMELCECAGFTQILVETVGTGQSEIEVRELCDLVILLVQPHTGDELQGIKKGILEIADFIVVHKADQEKENLAKEMHAEFRRNFPSKQVFTASSYSMKGIKELAQALQASLQPKNRQIQKEVYWHNELSRQVLQKAFYQNPKKTAVLEQISRYEISLEQALQMLLS